MKEMCLLIDEKFAYSQKTFLFSKLFIRKDYLLEKKALCILKEELLSGTLKSYLFDSYILWKSEISAEETD